MNIINILSIGMVSVDYLSLMLEVVLMCILALYGVMLFTSKLDINKIKYYAIAILCAGTGLYFYGFSLEEAPEGVWSTFTRSLLSAIELFVSHTDLLEIEEAQHQPFFMDFFIFVYASAVITSISALVSMFGRRTMSRIYLRLSREKKINHIFLGINRNSILLAKSLEEIIDRDKERIIFIFTIWLIIITRFRLCKLQSFWDFQIVGKTISILRLGDLWVELRDTVVLRDIPWSVAQKRRPRSFKKS